MRETMTRTAARRLAVQLVFAAAAGTDLSVEDISRLLGFSSSSYFRKVFFAGTKKTPREYRRSKQFSD